MKSFSSLSIFGLAIALVISAFSATSAGARHFSLTSANNVYIHQSTTALGTQVFILQDYTGPGNQGNTAGNINTNSLTLMGTTTPVTLLNVPATPYAPANPAMWYFYLAPGQTAQLTNYLTTPVHLSLWVPVDSSATGQDPSTAWFANYCFASTFPGAPGSATPAGATFAEIHLGATPPNIPYAPAFDTVDISEVNGVNAQWSIDLPGGWSSSAYRTGKNGNLIPVDHIQNNPGPGTSNPPNFYGDYGNPGVFPYGCTNCASRYNNLTNPVANPPGTQKSGCLSTFNGGVLTYPSNDVGCDNAINYYPTNANPASPPPPLPANLTAPLAGYQNPPPGVHALPVDSYYHSLKHDKDTLYNLNYPTNANLFYGYGICNILRGPSGSGGSVEIKLDNYPFGQKQ